MYILISETGHHFFTYCNNKVICIIFYQFYHLSHKSEFSLTQTSNLDWRAWSRTGQNQTHTLSLPGRHHHGASCGSAWAGGSVHAGSGAVRTEAAGWSVCCGAPGGEEQDLTLSAAGRPHPTAQWKHSGLSLKPSTLQVHTITHIEWWDLDCGVETVGDNIMKYIDLFSFEFFNSENQFADQLLFVVACYSKGKKFKIATFYFTILHLYLTILSRMKVWIVR